MMSVDNFMTIVLKFYGLKFKVLSVIILMSVVLTFIISKIELMACLLSCLKKLRLSILSSDTG